jgi:CBS domain-containing protein
MPDENSSLTDFNLTQPVKNLVRRAPVFVASNATVAEAAQQMQSARIGSVLVATDPPGILTDRDLRGRVVAASRGPATPVTQVMTRPLITIASDSPAFGALRLMIDANIHHLPLLEEGKIVGVISATDLLAQQANHPIYLRGLIDRLEDTRAIGDYAGRIADLAKTLFEAGLGALQISQIVSGLNDTLVKRLVQLAEQALGRAPTPYAWIVFGSEGRTEQTLLTDQDNALIFTAATNECLSYFGALSKRVVDGLIQAGFPPCPGGFMATNWYKPLAEWRELFDKWIRLPEPQALLDAAIFFDFRAVAGSLSLEPLEKIITSAQNEKRFLAHMLNGALAFHPPLGFFNRLRSEGGKIDIKKSGIAPIVGLARVAALGVGSLERSTLERLVTAGQSGALLNQDDASALAEIFKFFLQLRLRQQLATLQANRPLDHNIHLNALSTLERRHLKEGFVMIRRIQEGIRAWCSWEIVPV